MRGVRDERWKLIEYVVENRRHTQLFDLQVDPWELTNLASEPAHAEHLVRLCGIVAEWQDELGDTQADMGKLFWDGYRS